MFWECAVPVDISVPPLGDTIILEILECCSVTEEAYEMLSSSLIFDIVEIEGEDEESVEICMSFSIKRPLRSNGMHWSELSKKEEEEIERVVESLHLQIDPFSGDIKASEDILTVEFEKISSGEDSCDTKHNRV